MRRIGITPSAGSRWLICHLAVFLLSQTSRQENPPRHVAFHVAPTFSLDPPRRAPDGRGVGGHLLRAHPPRSLQNGFRESSRSGPHDRSLACRSANIYSRDLQARCRSRGRKPLTNRFESPVSERTGSVIASSSTFIFPCWIEWPIEMTRQLTTSRKRTC
jgi:hypothetical protein